MEDEDSEKADSMASSLNRKNLENGGGQTTSSLPSSNSEEAL